jgi:hypothetical protein
VNLWTTLLAVVNPVVPQLGKIRRASNEKAKRMRSCDKENIASPSRSIGSRREEGE